MRVAKNPPTRHELRAFLQGGPSLIAATRDDRMVVELTRCAAAVFGDDGRVYVAIPLPEGKRALANIETTGVLALNAAIISSYATVQLKGTDACRVEWPERVSIAASHRARFGANLQQVGQRAEVADSLWSSESAAVAFTPHEMFDQTPGPDAGMALEP